MKKSIQIIGVLAVMLVTLFACKKKEAEIQKEERFSVAVKMENEQGNLENAIIIGTKAELKAALTEKEKKVTLNKMSKLYNVYSPVVGPVKEPADPTKACWDQLNAIVASKKAEWQALANENCMPVVRCLTCPSIGLNALFVTEPNSPKCRTLPEFEAAYSLISFRHTNDQLDSKEVGGLVTGKH